MKRWFALLLAVCLGRGVPLAAQTRAADSLRALLRADARTDTIQVQRLQALSNEIMLADLPQAIALLEQSLALSQKISDPVGQGKALVRLGTLYRRQSNYPQARQYTKQAQALFTRRADRAGLAKTYLQLSFINMGVGDLVASLQAAVQGLPYAEQAGDRLTYTRLQVAAGSVYVQSGNADEALPVLEKALKEADVLGDKHMVVAALNLLGNAYQLQKNWSQALACFQRSERLNRTLGDQQSATTDQIDMSELYAEQHNYREALRHGLRARRAALANQDKYNLPPAELALAHAYLLGGQTDSAIALARHGFELSRPMHTLENLRNASEVLSEAYARRQQFAEAYRYARLWAVYRDSIAGDKAQKKINVLRYGYQLGRQRDQIALLTQARQLQAQKAERQSQRMRGLLAGLLGVLVLAGLLGRNIYLKQRANRALNAKNDQIAQQRDRLDQALTTLQTTQAQLVQSEKMVALAALTAGVAHEIQNPLNFVNNFSEVSVELVAELQDERREVPRDPDLEAALLGDLKQNLLKIHQHGTRASDIVRGMLEHARTDAGQRQAVDLNGLVKEYLLLAYHSLRAQHRTITVARTLDLDPHLGLFQLVPQEMGRVLLNLFTNAFYAVQRQAEVAGPAYAPEVRVITRRVGARVELRVRDNGTGIPAAVVEKIFEPFFTTKPAGVGTGLGLWLSYDIIVKGYGGELTVSTREGEYTEFIITLPRTAPRAAEVSRPNQELVAPD